MNTKFKTYLWQGIDGNQNKIAGEILAVNIRLARAELQTKKIYNLKIKRKFLLSNYRARITSTEITLALQQLVTLLSAGVPILQALMVIAENHENLMLRNLFVAIKEKIQQGHSLSTALQSHPKYFNHLLCALIAAGEQSGTLDILLAKAITHREKTQQLKNKIKKALFYPGAVIAIAVIVTYVLLVFVVPQFAELFAGFGAPLPLLTRVIIKLAIFLQHFWYLVLLGLCLPIVTVILLRRYCKSVAISIDKLILHLPIVGSILQKSIMARLLQTLAITFSSGMPLLESLRLLENVADNASYCAGLKTAYMAVDKGQTLYQGLQASGLFPNIVTQMVAIGEEAGKLPDMLLKTAVFFQDELDQLVGRLNQLLEPVIMVVLGIIVGGLVIAMYLPIFKLGMVI